MAIDIENPGGDDSDLQAAGYGVVRRKVIGLTASQINHLLVAAPGAGKAICIFKIISNIHSAPQTLSILLCRTWGLCAERFGAVCDD